MDVTLETLEKTEKSLADGVVWTTKAEYWVVKVDGVIVCVTGSLKAAKRLRAYLLSKKMLASYLAKTDLQYKAMVNGKCVARCASPEIAKIVEDGWGTPPPPTPPSALSHS